MLKKIILCILMACCVFHVVFAGAMGETFRYVGTFSLGPVWATGDAKQQAVAITPTIKKTYIQNTAHSALLDGELFFGVQYSYHSWQSQTGLAVAVTSRATISGEVWDQANPEFNNYVHNYHVQHTHLAIKEKLLLNKAWPVMPWVSGSLGVAWNTASGFRNTPVIPEAIVMPNFLSHTQAAFTYTVGAGIQRILTNHWQTGVGYEFADWGSNHLGSSTGQTVGYGPGASHLYTNGLLVNLTYIA